MLLLLSELCNEDRLECINFETAFAISTNIFIMKSYLFQVLRVFSILSQNSKDELHR